MIENSVFDDVNKLHPIVCDTAKSLDELVVEDDLRPRVNSSGSLFARLFKKRQVSMLSQFNYINFIHCLSESTVVLSIQG